MISCRSISLMLCPCCSGKSYQACCQFYIEGEASPSTPEALMRSRYTAYVLTNLVYIQKTMRGHAALDFNFLDAERWAKRVICVRLEVKKTGLFATNHGFVEFIATMVEGSHLLFLHEKSEFILENGLWYYTGGTQFPTPRKRIVSRNGPCPCGSLRKYKNCHGIHRV